MNIIIGSMTAWFFWHLIMAFMIILVPSQLKVGDSFWNLPDDVTSFLLGFFFTYISSAILLGVRHFQRKKLSIPEILLLPIAVFSIYLFYILAVEAYYSRSLLFIGSVLAVISIFLSFALKPKLQIIFITVIAIFTASLQTLETKPTNYLVSVFDLGPKPTVSKKLINSSLYKIQILSFRNYFQNCNKETGICSSPPTGGGISGFGDGYLLSTGDGKLHYLTIDKKKGTLEKKLLPFRIPINEEVYVADLGHNTRHTFRVTDILVVERDSEFDLFAVHHYWKSDKKCGVLRVSKTSGNIDSLIRGDKVFKWESLFDTRPCIPAADDGLTRGSESGGRIAVLQDGSLLLTVGDHEYDGIIKQPIMAQKQESSYGKILLINPKTGTSVVYSMGHRNPQGLFIDSSNTIWSTEHGPQGGDEFNTIERGANYGWPLTTFGTQYGMHTWPLSSNQGRHEGYKQPLFTWVNSIAISNLYRLDGELFSLWRGDFIIGSLKKKFYRLRVVNGQVRFVETLPIPFRTGRIRDLFEDKEGRIVLYMDDGSLNFLSPLPAQSDKWEGNESLSPEVRGQYLFMTCAACHKIEDGHSHGIGPDLSGVLGKKIASSENYNYSEALSNIPGTWTKEKLDQFLMDPQKMAPGTTMAILGIPDKNDRQALIQYIENNK